MEKEKKLEEIAEKVANCKQCSLYQKANRPVPGEGNPRAVIMFIGEAPGFYEDQEGRPFVGQAGRLLDVLLSSIGLGREEVFIANLVKHRPPGNREPMPEEIEACRFFLDRQIKIIDPKVIVTLGRFSMNKFLPGEYISQAHGRARFVNLAVKKRIIIPMYHPAAALRNGRIMTELKQDFQKITDFLRTANSVNIENQPEEPENQEEQLRIL